MNGTITSRTRTRSGRKSSRREARRESPQSPATTPDQAHSRHSESNPAPAIKLPVAYPDDRNDPDSIPEKWLSQAADPDQSASPPRMVFQIGMSRILAGSRGMKVTVEDRDVGELADFERPQPVLHPDRDGGIDLDRIATDSRTSISVPANRNDSAVQHGDRLGARLRSVPGPDRAVPNQRFHCQIDQPTGTTGRSAIAASTASSGYSRSCIEPPR